MTNVPSNSPRAPNGADLGWREQAQEYDQRLQPDALIDTLQGLGFTVLVMSDGDTEPHPADEDNEFTFADALGLRGLDPDQWCDDCGRYGAHDPEVEH